MAKTVGELRTQLSEWNPNGLPCSGQISASDINVELGRPYNAEFNMGGSEERALAEVPTGQISFSDFHCKSAIPPVFTLQLTVGKLDGFLYIYGFSTDFQAGDLYGNLSPRSNPHPFGTSVLTGAVSTSEYSFNGNPSTFGFKYDVFDDNSLVTNAGDYYIELGYNGTVANLLFYDETVPSYRDVDNNDLYNYIVTNDGNTITLTITWKKV